MQHKDRLSDEERIERRRAAAKRYRDANKEKCVAASLASRAKKPEEYAAKNAEWKATNEAYIQAQKEYRVVNRDKLNAQTVAWQKANPEHFKAYMRQYAVENQIEIHARQKVWRKENPELQRLQNSSRRARVRKQMGIVSKDIIKN